MVTNAWDAMGVAHTELQGKTWPKSESTKKCRFCYAKIQGDPSVVSAEAEGVSKKSSEEAV